MTEDELGRPTPEDLEQWLSVLEKGAAIPGMLLRVVATYRELYGVFLPWVEPPIEVERVQYVPKALDLAMTGGPYWRLPAVWLEGKLSFLRELGLLDYCVRCTRVHPIEFTCEGDKKNAETISG